MDSRIALTYGRSLSNLPLFVAESAGLFEAEGLDVEVPRFTTLSSTSDIIALGVSDLGTVAFTEPLIDAPRDNPPIGGGGLLDHAARHHPGCDRADLEAGARRQPPCIDIRHPKHTIHDRQDALQSLGLVPRNDRPPPNVLSFDPLAGELERAGRTGPNPSRDRRERRSQP